MAEKFVVKKGTTGKFRFSLVGRNGRVIATSEAYNSKAACMNGIKAVQARAGRASVEDQTHQGAGRRTGPPQGRGQDRHPDSQIGGEHGGQDGGEDGQGRHREG